MFTEKVSVTTTPPPPMRLVIVDPGFIRDRSGRERRRPVLPTGPVHSGPASPVTATCPPSASRQSRPRRRPAIARHQLGDCDRIPGPRSSPCSAASRYQVSWHPGVARTAISTGGMTRGCFLLGRDGSGKALPWRIVVVISSPRFASNTPTPVSLATPPLSLTHRQPSVTLYMF